MPRRRLISDEQILASMRKNVLAHGPHVSLDVVAEELDVTAPALLKRFGSRQALMIAALRPDDNPEWIQLLAKGPGKDPLKAQLLDMFTRISGFMRDAVPCLMALRESGIPGPKMFHKTTSAQAGLKAINGWLEQAKSCGLVSAQEVHTAAYAILGALQTRVFFSHMLQQAYSAKAERDYLQELASMFTRALESKKP